MFGAFGTLMGSRATAGATSPRDKPGHGGKSGSHLQHAAPRARLRGGRYASVTGLPVVADLAPALLEPVAPRKFAHSLFPPKDLATFRVPGNIPLPNEFTAFSDQR